MGPSRSHKTAPCDRRNPMLMDISLAFLVILMVTRFHYAGALTYEVRFEGGDGPWEGRVEILGPNGTWGIVCNRGWGDTDAVVVCRNAGYQGGREENRERFEQGDGPIWLDDIICTGEEHQIAECDHAGWGVHDCTQADYASVHCTGGGNRNNDDNEDAPEPVVVETADEPAEVPVTDLALDADNAETEAEEAIEATGEVSTDEAPANSDTVEAVEEDGTTDDIVAISTDNVVLTADTVAISSGNIEDGQSPILRAIQNYDDNHRHEHTNDTESPLVANLIAMVNDSPSTVLGNHAGMGWLAWMMICIFLVQFA